ncbi:hypothetical protein RHODO2019_15710 [Rhodococcus antarcticus]|uniref:Galactan 5-O-arabinofuranosyltransferase n=1 Tax=Rhodococcus antarcticus TaxID=2987751 RepID=A0ABY6NZV6_9NOCA|nr:DUF6541 family protein [Rhodococcus antarcticus]UZJ24551.1 hypothetical protein RHODO2019_15710 [Rhodococcus antarcticus]
MITWLQGSPALLLAAVLLLLPGAAIGMAWRLRGLAVLLVAPPISLAVVAVASLCAPVVGLRWGFPALAATTAVVAAAVLALRGHTPHHGGIRADARLERPHGGVPAGRSTWVFVLGGWAVAALLVTTTFRLGVGRPDEISQTYDGVFHLNVLRYIQTTGSSSPLDVQGMIGGTYYPSLWHALASLVVPASADSVPAAANLTSLGVAVVVWPLGCVFLARQVLGPRPVLLGLAAILSAAFTGFPWVVLSWGVLWPNAMGVALLPAVIACLTSAVGTARNDLLGGRRTGWLATGAAALACGSAHPGALISGIVLGSVLLVVQGVQRARGSWSTAARRRGLAGLAATLGVVTVGWAVLLATPGIRQLQQRWDATVSAPEGVAQHLVGTSDGARPAYLVSALVLVGAFRCACRPELRWLLAAHLVSVGLDVLTASSNGAFAHAVAAFWYDDRHRLLAVVPVTGVVLAVVGVEGLHSLVVCLGRSRGGPVGRAGRTARASAPTMVALVLAVSAGVLGISGNAFVLASTNSSASNLVTVQEQEFMQQLDQVTPTDALIIGNPWDGSSLAWAVGDRAVLFPYFAGTRTPAAQYLADHLNNLDTDPEVCRAVRETGVTHVLRLNPSLFTSSPRGYTGTYGAGNGPGFTPVLVNDVGQLFLISGCR